MDRIDWLNRQISFHKRRSGAWHSSQKNWYKRELRKIPLHVFLSKAFKKHHAEIAKSVLNNNVLFRQLTKQKPAQGGLRG